MDMVSSWLMSGINTILPFVILISLTVFVHELGHFLVAKYFGVRVEVFSIGIGKKFWKRQFGETEYALSLFPIGGYVKMFGDELGAEVDEKEKAYSFVHKPVLQRIAVVLAGPIMNLFFAFLLFMGIAMIGEEQKAPILGDIVQNTEAFNAGFRSGDTLLTLGGQSLRSWAEAQKIMDANISKPVSIKVRHISGQEQEISFIPQLVDDTNLFALKKQIGSIQGLTNLAAPPGIGIADEKSWAFQAGFRTGDFITKIQDKEVKYWYELESLFSTLSGPLTIVVSRGAVGDKFEDVVLKIPEFPAHSNLAALGFEKGEQYVAKVMEGAPAEKSGLKAGDKIIEIQGQPVASWDFVQTTIRNFNPEQQKDLQLKVLRQGQVQALTLSPEMSSTTSSQGIKENRFTIGIVPWLYPSTPEMTKVIYGLSLDGFKRGLERTWEVTAMTAISMLKLFKAEISPRNISGIISIGQVASETFKMGLGQFFTMMGVISINLFLLNLLPIPVLDGGHMVFYTIELLKGSPLSLRKIEMAQKFGIVVLMSLMVFALFNDFARLFGH